MRSEFDFERGSLDRSMRSERSDRSLRSDVSDFTLRPGTEREVLLQRATTAVRSPFAD